MRSAWIVASALLLPPPAFAAASADAKEDPVAQEVRAVVERTVNEVLDVLKDKDLERDERKKKVMAVVDPVFDLQLMGMLVLGGPRWAELGKVKRRDEYTQLFVKTIQDSYYEKIELFTDETVEFEAPSPTEKGKFQMLTRVISKGQRYKLLYKLYRKGAAWKIYDMEIEGISLVRAYKSQYEQFLAKSTLDGLLAKMKEKAFDTPKELARKPKPPASEKPEAPEDAKPKPAEGSEKL